MINKLATTEENFYKRELNRKETSYVILGRNDNPSFFNKIKISQRKRNPSNQNMTPSQLTPTQLPKSISISQTTMTFPNSDNKGTQTETEMEGVNSCSNQNLNNDSNFKKMTKMDSPEALFHFFGMERAKKIKKENKIKPTGDILRKHIEDQVIKLQKAHLTLNG